MTEIIRVTDVSFTYRDTPAIRDISLTINEGEFLGLIGPNGSGKTTLLHIMLGLLTPDTGTVEVFGEPIEDFTDGHRIGYVSQHPSTRGGTMPVTVREVVEMGRYAIAGLRPLSTDDQRAIDDALRTVKITDLQHRRVNSLSGGQRQRAFIARALAGNADLLALDEPTVGVDAESRDQFYGLLDRLNGAGLTIILIEHDIGVVTDRANRIACINQELFHHGDIESFINSDALSAAYGAATTVVHHDHTPHDK